MPGSLPSTPSNNKTKGLGPNYAIGKFDGADGMSLSGFSVDRIPSSVQDIASFGIQSPNLFAFYLSSESARELVVGGVYPVHYFVEFSVAVGRQDTCPQDT